VSLFGLFVVVARELGFGGERQPEPKLGNVGGKFRPVEWAAPQQEHVIAAQEGLALPPQKMTRLASAVSLRRRCAM